MIYKLSQLRTLNHKLKNLLFIYAASRVEEADMPIPVQDRQKPGRNHESPR